MNYQQNNQVQFQQGQTLERPKKFHRTDALMRDMKWDSNDTSALFFFVTGEDVGQGENKTKKWTNFSVRFRGRDAAFLAEVLAYKKSEETNNRKFTALISMELKTASWERPTGEKWGENNENDVTETVSYFEGKNSLLMNAKDYTIQALASAHIMPNEQKHAQQA